MAWNQGEWKEPPREIRGNRARRFPDRGVWRLREGENWMLDQKNGIDQLQTVAESGRAR